MVKPDIFDDPIKDLVDEISGHIGAIQQVIARIHSSNQYDNNPKEVRSAANTILFHTIKIQEEIQNVKILDKEFKEYIKREYRISGLPTRIKDI